MINLGDVAKDTITGFEGVVVAETRWLHGCRRLTLQPKALHEGKPVEPNTFDAPQLELVERAAGRAEPTTGGPQPEPRCQPDPRR